MLIRLLAADIALVDFDNLAETTELGCGRAMRGHRLADTVREKPCRLEADFERAVQLVRADALLGRANQEGRLERLMQREAGVFKDGPNLHRELLPAVMALPEAVADALLGVRLDLVSPTQDATVRA